MEDIRYWGILIGIVANLIGLCFLFWRQGNQNGQLIQKVNQFSNFIEAFDSMKYVDEGRLKEKQISWRNEVDGNLATCKLELSNEISLMRKDLSVLVSATKKAEESRERHAEKNEKRWDDLQKVLLQIANNK